MNNHPYSVSIVTIVFNGAAHIEQTMQSVLHQTYAPIEYIVIDGGSTDGTLSVIDKYRYKIAYFISEPDSGIYDAINKGISKATGSLIGLIHCGDYYELNAVSEAVAGFVSSGADIIYGDINVIEEYEDKIITIFKKSDHRNLKRNMSIFHPATFVSRQCYARYGLYDPKFKSAADYDYFLKLYSSGVEFKHINKLLATFRAGGTSGSNFKLTAKENFTIRKNQIGKLNAINYLMRNIIVCFYLSGRKWFVEKFIGKNNYIKLKKWYYSGN